MKSVRFEPLDPGVYREIVRRALLEDVGRGDVTTETVIDGDQKARAVVLSKSSCVIAGLDIASEAFRQLDPRVAVVVRCKDGDGCEPATVVAEYRGQAAALLTAERTALNFLQRLSGIATFTAPVRGGCRWPGCRARHAQDHAAPPRGSRSTPCAPAAA